ncbi:ankyrin repeat protein [Metarhizium robertsii]|uniref:Ankyrin repeat protein n=1 Tax=Metarhizium robertsii TaxID=568076 RepID=A0A014N5Y7_9HYPO|nr:ankyrin repeat protein [Metarhizium robertsii]
MKPHAGLDNTPVELLFCIFKDLSLAQLDVLEQACVRHPLLHIIRHYFHRRVVNTCTNPLPELAQIGRVKEIEYLASHSDLDVNVRDIVGQTPLHIAAKTGHVAVVRALLRFPGVVVDRRDDDGGSALVFAAQHGHIGVTELLLQHGAEIDGRTHRGETAFLWAARNGRKNVVSLLISEMADPLIMDAEGWSGLDWAIMDGQDDVVEMLLRHHGHFQESSVRQNEVLLLAAESGNDSAVRMMLAAGADVDCRDGQQSTPLHWAVSFGHRSTAELLLDGGADANSRDKYGNTPLHWAISYPTIMKPLLDRGVEVDIQNMNGKTSLMWSVLAEQRETTQMLLGRGAATVNVRDENGCTALHGAAAKGCNSIIICLLDKGADVTATDKDGWTPLDVATINGHVAAMALLQGKGKPAEGIAAARLALKMIRNEDTAHIMREMAQRKLTGSDGVSGLRSAVNCKHAHRLLALLGTGVDIDELDPVGGATALTLAAWFNEEKIAKLLLENGAAVDAMDSDGRTALHVAVEGGYCDLVALLLQNGANVEARFCGWTPLLLAAKRLWDDEAGPWMVECLSVRVVGANLDARDYFGRAVQHWCAAPRCQGSLRPGGAAHSHWSVPVQALLQQGVALDGRTCDGLTPAHVAAYTGQLNVLTLLGHACRCIRDHRGTDNRGTDKTHHHLGARLRLDARDVDGYTPLTLALLTGNLHVAQFLRQLPGGGEGDLQFRSSTTYHEIATRCPPSLQLPTEDEDIDVSHAREGSCPRRPLFGVHVREWLRDQHKLVGLETEEV